MYILYEETNTIHTFYLTMLTHNKNMISIINMNQLWPQGVL